MWKGRGERKKERRGEGGGLRRERNETDKEGRVQENAWKERIGERRGSDEARRGDKR